MPDAPLFNDEKYALNPVFCKGEAAFSHLSGGGTCESFFFQLGHLELLHTAPPDSNTFFYEVEQEEMGRLIYQVYLLLMHYYLSS